MAGGVGVAVVEPAGAWFESKEPSTFTCAMSKEDVSEDVSGWCRWEVHVKHSDKE